MLREIETAAREKKVGSQLVRRRGPWWPAAVLLVISSLLGLGHLHESSVAKTSQALVNEYRADQTALSQAIKTLKQASDQWELAGYPPTGPEHTAQETAYRLWQEAAQLDSDSEARLKDYWVVQYVYEAEQNTADAQTMTSVALYLSLLALVVGLSWIPADRRYRRWRRARQLTAVELTLEDLQQAGESRVTSRWADQYDWLYRQEAKYLRLVELRRQAVDIAERQLGLLPADHPQRRDHEFRVNRLRQNLAAAQQRLAQAIAKAHSQRTELDAAQTRDRAQLEIALLEFEAGRVTDAAHLVPDAELVAPPPVRIDPAVAAAAAGAEPDALDTEIELALDNESPTPVTAWH